MKPSLHPSLLTSAYILRSAFALLALCVVLADGSLAQQADSVQPSCAVDVPPVAEIILPQTPVMPGGVLPITLVGAADLKDVSVTLTERTPDFALENRQPLRATEQVGELSEKERQDLRLPLPPHLLRSTDRQLQRRSAAAKEAEPTLLLLEVTGTLPDGSPAYSGAVLVFEEVRGGTFRVLTLPEYVGGRANQRGVLYELPQSEIGVERAVPVYDVQPEPEDRSNLFMDAEGRISESDVPEQGRGGAPITVTVSGTIYFTGWDGTSKPLSYGEVAVWEDDGNTASASFDNIVLTNSSGYFSTTVVHDDGDSALELFLMVKTANEWVRLGNGYTNGLVDPFTGEAICDGRNNYCGLDSENNTYQWEGPLRTGVTGGSEVMNYTIADYRRGGAQVFDWLQDSAGLTHSAFNPGQVRVVWNLPGEGAASLSNFGNHLRFAAIHGPDRSEDVAYHEYGHFTMYRRNSYRNPNTGGPHSICGQIHPAFAWSEGWATGFAQHVVPDGYYDSASFDFRAHVEDARLGYPTCSYPPNNQSVHNEMWVAGAVNDFFDFGEPTGGDDPADRIHTFFQETEVIRTTNIDSIYEFYDELLTSGYLTQTERNYASRVMNYNQFPVGVEPPPSPLTATINGPTSLASGQGGTWTGSVSGGSGTINHQWHWRVFPEDDGCTGTLCDMGPTWGAWTNGGTGSSFTRSMRYGEGRMELRLTVTRGGATAVDLHNVYNSNPIAGPGDETAARGGAGEVMGTDAARGSAGMPLTFALRAVYPNPSRGQTAITVDVPEAAEVVLAVYDVLGREMARLLDGLVEGGTYYARFDGAGLPSGLYLVRFQAGGFAATSRITLLK